MPTDPRLAALVYENIAGYAVLTLADDGTVTSWNRSAAEITGYEAEEALGRRFHFLFAQVDQAAGQADQELALARRDGRAEDTRWHVRKNGERFWANGLTLAASGLEYGAFVKVFRDETPGKVADEHRILLLNELNHRVKNTLATVQSLAEQTLRRANVDPTVRDTLVNRLMALSGAHNILVQESWAGASLLAIVTEALRPFCSHGEAVAIDGPAVPVSPAQALSIAMILHELSTNAVKYGALGGAHGRVTITWNVAHDSEGRRELSLLWEEAGGPPVTAPQNVGFGTRMIQRSVGAGGRVDFHFQPTGLCCVVVLALAEREAEAEGPKLEGFVTQPTITAGADATEG